MSGGVGTGRRRIAFGPFAIDVAAGCLRRGSAVVPLRRKSWEVLCYLASRPGRVVPNDEILDRVWPRTSVTPQTLTNVIHEIRVALEDTAAKPRFIETVHARGHVFRPPRRPRRGAAPPRERVTGRPERAPHGLVGRDRELGRLHEMLEEVRARRSRLVFLTGEPGIGKTTLAGAFLDEIGHDPRQVRIARGTCVEHHGRGEAFLPLLEVIDGLLAGAGGRAVGDRLRRFAPTWLVQLPWRVAPAEREPLESALSGTTPLRMLREGIAFFRSLGADRPLVLLLEDLHWSDSSTLDFLAALARRPVDAAVLVIATFRRADAAARAHPVAGLARDLALGGHAAEIALGPFGRDAVEAYLEARVGALARGTDLADRLEQHSAGNPLFLRSLVDQLVLCGTLAGTPDRWRLERDAETRTSPGWSGGSNEPSIGQVEVASLAQVRWQEVLLELPKSLRDFVLASVEGLPPAERAAIEAASVVGLEFTAPEIARAAQMSPMDAEGACDRLVRLGRLLCEARAADAPGGTDLRNYAFVHAAYRRAVYESLSPLRRQALHREAAHALEEMPNARLGSARLATHFERGGLPAKAAYCFDLAAVDAEHRFAYRESAAYLRAALAQLESTGPDADRSLVGGLYVRLGGLLSLVAGYAAPEPREAFARARAAFEGVDAPVGSFMADMGLCRNVLASGELRTGRVHADRLMALARTELPALTAVACLWVGFATSALGELEAARAALVEGVGAELAPGFFRHQDIHRILLSQLALVRTVCGEIDRGAADASAALARSRAAGRTADLAHALLLETERHVFLRDARRGRAVAEELIGLAGEDGLLSFLALARIHATFFAVERPAGERLSVMRDALEERRRLGDRWHESMVLALIAEVELASGDGARALATLEEADAFIARTDEGHHVPEVHRLRGECALALGGGSDEAARWFALAMEDARGRGARLWELRAACSRARLALATGRPSGGIAALSSLLASFPSDAEYPDLAEARRLSGRLGGAG